MQDRTIHIVDDHAGMRAAIDSLLRCSGYATMLHETADSILSSPHPSPIDCIILDISLQGACGLQVHRDLVARGSLTPVIFISGNRDEEAIHQALQLGAVAFLTKPFRDDDLLHAVSKALHEMTCRHGESGFEP